MSPTATSRRFFVAVELIEHRRNSRVLYRTRKIVERFLKHIKHFRRVCARYDKLVDTAFAFASLACASGPLVKCEQNLAARHGVRMRKTPEVPAYLPSPFATSVGTLFTCSWS